MITLLIGTQAQLIKCAPVLHALRVRGVPIRLVDSGQHADTTRTLLTGLDLPDFDSTLGGESDVDTVAAGLRWLVRGVVRCGVMRERVRAALGESTRMVIVHGDTASTWLGALAASRCGVPVGHLEAGLTSGSMWSPFPEELIRRSVMKRSAVLFAPGEWAAKVIRERGYRGRLVTLSGNTNQEVLHYALDRIPPPVESAPYTLVSIHRLETIQSRGELRKLARVLVEWSRERWVRFAVHRPTRKRLERMGLWSTLEQSEVELLPPQGYLEFVRLLRDAESVVTDGGSVQEECAYLGKPCLIWRNTTERPDGLGDNALLAHRDPLLAADFLMRVEAYRRPAQRLTSRPSEEVAEFLSSFLSGPN